EVEALFNAHGVGPLFTLSAPANIDQGATLTITPNISAGTPPLTYSWTDGNSSLTGSQLTNEVLTVSNITASDTYTLTINNNFTPFSSQQSVFVNVISNLQMFADISPANSTLYAGTPVTYS